MERIVVGVDGSSNSERALQWAADEARRRGARLVVATAWHEPSAAFASAYTAADDPALYREAATQTMDQMLASVDVEGVDVERQVVEGQPARVLLDLAAGAHLLVVGTRGHGGFVGLLIGSVSQHLSQHAPCPVVIVPPTSTV